MDTVSNKDFDDAALMRSVIKDFVGHCSVNKDPKCSLTDRKEFKQCLHSGLLLQR